MFASLFCFELKYLSRQLSWWFGLIMLTVFGFFMSGKVVISGNVLALSPQNLTYAMTFLSQIAIFTTTLITANSALRDANYNFSSFVQTKPVDNKVLLLSRFASLFLMSFLIVLSALMAILLPTLITNSDPEVFGVFKVSYLMWPLAVVVLPNLLLTASLLFFCATVFKTTLMTFLSGISIYILYLLSAALLDSPMFTASAPLGRDEINYASLFDPFAVSAFLEQTQYWTSEEKNTDLVNLSGNFLYNRLIWLFVSFALLASLLLKPFSTWGKISKKVQAFKCSDSGTADTAEHLVSSKYVAQLPELSSWKAFKANVIIELRMTLRGLPFLLLLALVAVLAIAQLINGIQNNFFVGVQHPYTSTLLTHIARPLDMVGLFIVVFFTGEMVWRAKDLNFDAVIAVTPAPVWLHFLSKVTVMVCLIFMLIAISGLVGLGYQLWAGFYANDLDLFLSLIPIYGLPLLLMAIFSLSIQSIVSNKYVGFVVVAGALLVAKTDIALLVGLEHNLLRFADFGPHHFSDFSGYDFFVRNMFWFACYWTLITGVIAIVCYGVSKRALDEPILSALKRLSFLLSPKGMLALQISALLTVLCGGFVFYNTNIVNHYMTTADMERFQLDYELELNGYKYLPSPKITDMYLEVDFFPNQHQVSINGHYLLTNPNQQNVDRFIITLPNHDQIFEFDFGAERTGQYTATQNQSLNVIEITLSEPLSPNQSMRLNFTTGLSKQGFKNADSDISLLANGSYFHSSTLLPFIGYNANYELRDDATRLAEGLATKELRPPLVSGTQYDMHGHENDASWINYEAVVSTSLDQIALAPGTLKKQWHENERAYFHYKVDHEISNFLGFASAQYQTQSIYSGNTKINAYYHASHDRNIELMLNTASEALSYFEQAYGPYPFAELNLVEIPNRGFARAYPGTIYISEHVGFKEDLTQGTGHDDFSYLIAHEIAHQWWGHQLASAKTEGEVLLIESLADYSALMVMQKIYGQAYVNQVVADSTQTYLKGRSADVIGETPLHKILGQRYLRYHKGPVVLHAISQLITEQSLNQALKELLEQKADVRDDYATSLDLIKGIKAASGNQHHALIDEWLTDIVTYDLSIAEASIEMLANGTYQVSAQVSGQSFTHLLSESPKQHPFNHRVTVTALAEVSGQAYLIQKQEIQMVDGVQSVTFMLPQRPSKLVIDPNYLFIDRNRIDNEIRISQPQANIASH